MSQPPAPTGAPPQQPPYPYAYPYAYPYYARPPPRSDSTVALLVILIVVLVAVVLFVCSAIMYVLVSGLISGPGSGPQAMGVTVSRSSDGMNWVLLVSSTPSGKAYALTRLTIFRTDGTSNLTATPFANLDVAGEGCALQQADAAATTVTVGDRILCRTSWYAVNSGYQVSDGRSVLASGKLVA